MRKIVANGRSVDFRADVKTYNKPAIVDTITNDEGIEVYVLENGNTFPKEKYDAIWNPVKGVVKKSLTEKLTSNGMEWQRKNRIK